MRILFVHSGSDLYGASRSLLRLSSRLARDGVCVKVVLPSDGPLVSALKENGVAVIVQRTLAVMERENLSGLRGLFDILSKVLLSTVSLVKLLKQFKPDIVHSMTAVILSSGLAAKLAGIPHIWHVRESFGEFGRLWSYYQGYMLWLSTRIICVSTPIAAQFQAGKTTGKVHVIHNGFPAEEFADVDTKRVNHFRERYGMPGAEWLIGVVGRIKFQRKGQEVFVRAAGLLRDKFPMARFLCIGSPFPGNEAHLAHLLKLVRELDLENYVVYTGDVVDIKAAIAGLDILVLSSVQPEPFAGVVVEAMALSRPVVATAIGGSIEQVVDGETGYLVQPGDPISMASAIENLLKSPGQRLAFGKNGRNRFLENFEFEPFYQRVMGIYQLVLNNER